MTHRSGRHKLVVVRVPWTIRGTWSARPAAAEWTRTDWVKPAYLSMSEDER